MEGYTVNVTNIANDGTDEEIKEFLSLVGPIKSFVPSRFERKGTLVVTQSAPRSPTSTTNQP